MLGDPKVVASGLVDGCAAALECFCSFCLMVGVAFWSLLTHFHTIETVDIFLHSLYPAQIFLEACEVTVRPQCHLPSDCVAPIWHWPCVGVG